MAGILPQSVITLILFSSHQISKVMRIVRTFWKLLFLDSKGSAENISVPDVFIVINKAL